MTTDIRRKRRMSRIDRECLPPLEALLQAVPGGLNAIPDIQARRQLLNDMMVPPDAQGNAPSLTIETMTLDTAQGNLQARLYAPRGLEGDGPGLIYIHGGGMIMGNLDTEDATCRRLCTELGIRLISIDYRKAPEHPYPTPMLDAYAGADWVIDHARDLNLIPDRVGLYGQSAGGGLALAVALRARDVQGPAFAFIGAVYPMIDDRHTTPSSRDIIDIGVWDRTGSLEAWNWYLAGQTPDSYAAPARAANLQDLPPVYMDVGELDLFRDENIEFARRLVEAGNPTEFHLWPGAYHGSEVFAPGADLSRRIWDGRFRAIRRLLSLTPETAMSVNNPDTQAASP